MFSRRLEFKAMGCPCTLELSGRSRPRIEAIHRAARDEVARIEHKYSRYRDDSLTTRINRSAGDPEGVIVDEETAALLDYADIAHRESDGLFDITSGILREAWDFRSNRLPTEAEIAALLPRIGWEKVRWERPRLVLPLAGMQVDFGGFGKEYAADRVAELCRERGARHGLVDFGGDLAVVGPHPDGSPWRVGVQNPRSGGNAIVTLPLAAGGIASSGDYQRFMVVDGVRYGHVLDPHTGWPVSGLASATVIASHCLLAGTATTVALLKGAGEGAAWLDSLGLPNLRVDARGSLSGSLALRRAA